MATKNEKVVYAPVFNWKPLESVVPTETLTMSSKKSDKSFKEEANELTFTQSTAEKLEEGEHDTSNKEDEEKAPEETSDALERILKYDREFLLRIGESPASKKKKNDIGIVDVLKSGGSSPKDQHRTPFNAQRRYGKDMRMSPPLNMGHRRWMGPGQPLSTSPTSPRSHARVIKIQTHVKLHQAENAWKPSHAVRGNSGCDGEVSADQKMTQSIVKQTRGILNKLTPENFAKLCDKFLKLELNDRDDRISAVINVVFEKAIDEPSFSAAYARMVRHVCMHSQETAKKFRKEILDQCQKEFQKSSKDENEIKIAEAEILSAPEDEKEQLKLELEVKKTQMRKRSLGNVRFIGELYKLQMLAPKIMIDCLHMLTHSQDEESYECLCKLLTTVGQKLDNQLKEFEQRINDAKSSSQSLPRFIPDCKFMDKTFAKLKQLSSETTKLSSRIRFAFLDVVELRENDWIPRRDSNAPKKIETVRLDALHQGEDEKRQINAPPDPIMRTRRSSPVTPQQSQSPQKKMGSDWSSVQSNNNRSSRFSTMTSPKMSEPIRRSPVLSPSTGSWKVQVQNRGNSNSLPRRLFQQQQQSPMSSSFGGQQSHNNSSGHLSQQILNPQMESSQHSNRFNILENQQCHSPPSQFQTSIIPEVLNLEPPTPEVNETVKNIFHEFCNVKKYDDTISWVSERFPGEKVTTFVDCLARQVGEMSKPDLQCRAGQLIKMLVKRKYIRREMVLKVLTEGLIPDIPDIQVDCPKVTTYVAVFMLEVFRDENNLNWLLELTKALKEEDAMIDLIRVTLDQLQLTKDEEYVKTLWKSTDERNSISEDCLPWPKEESVFPRSTPSRPNLTVHHNNPDISKKEQKMDQLKRRRRRR